MMRQRASSRTGQARPARGIALIAVLWIVAALGILVTGLVQAHRDEIRLVSSGRQTVQASALGSAAIQLTLQQMVGRTPPVARLSRIDVAYGGLTIPVDVMPLNGLVDINRASQRLLAALFTIAGGMPANSAATLATSVVAARAPGVGRTRGPRFEAIEDLLQLPGVDFDLYARLSSSITTDSSGNGRVNPMAAPESVLAVLAEGNTGRAAQIAAARDAGQDGVDTTNLTAEFLDNAAVTRYRLQARVPLADGRKMLSSRHVAMGRVAPDGVPWRIFQAEDRFEPATPTTNQ